MDANSQKGRVLVMDDEECIRDIFLKALSISGYEVCLSGHGVEAIECYSSAKSSGRPFDVLIIDLCIKNGMDGVETIDRLIDMDPGIKAIVCSGDMDHPVMGNHKQYGFCGVLPKPFSFEKLRNELEKVMNDHGKQSS